MYGDPPEKLVSIYDGLVNRWIRRGRTVDEQVDGLQAIFDAVWEVIEPLLGSVASLAMIRRTTVLAGRQDNRVRDAVGTARGLDVARLRLGLERESAESARQTLVVLADQLFSVLYALLGPTLLPILREVETELAARDGPPEGDEEKR